MQKTGRSLLRMAAALTALLALGLLTAQVSAAASKIKLGLSSPNTAEAGQMALVGLYAENAGDVRIKAPITVSDSVSPGLSAPVLAANFGGFETSVTHPQTPEETQFPTGTCEPEGNTITCVVKVALPPRARLIVHFGPEVQPGATGALRQVFSVWSSETPAVSSEAQTIAGPPAPFAITGFGTELTDQSEAPVTQAGSDPADYSTLTNMQSSALQWLGIRQLTVPAEHVRNVTVHLPAGLVGNPTAIPTCAVQLLAQSEYGQVVPDCPEGTQVGVAQLSFGTGLSIVPVYNVVPPPGAAAELGFNVDGVIVMLDAYLRPGDHGIDIVSSDTSATLPLTGVTVSIWGNPASPENDVLRARCLNFYTIAPLGNDGLRCASPLTTEKAFLRLPTSCSGQPLSFVEDANTWVNPEYLHASSPGPVITGCEKVPFSPTIYTQPTAAAANSPTGVAVQLSMPQTSNPEGVAEGDLKKAVVTLPEGMALNPSSADGLQACDDTHLKLDSSEPADCPEAAKVGTVVLKTPLLESSVEGFIWLRTQSSSDPESGEMFRLAIELRDDRHGIDVKLPGQVAANAKTGRLTSTFDNAPQLPFEDMTLHFKSGARAPLTTPMSCMTQTTEADLYPWARPNTPVHTDMTFNLTSGPEGTPCMSAQPFAPGFNAGVRSVQAGAYTPFLATFSRKDSDQSMQRVSVTMPKGLLGSLAGLPLCPEAQANAGTCDPASQIGSVTAGAGDGPTPFYVTGGRAYMTGPYEGAPFGLSIVVPAKAGPFDLGTVVVRAKVEIDPHTAQLTVTTDPLPQIVGGVPVNLRLVNTTIDRPNFTFNPTDCDPMEVSGTMTGGQGAVAPLANRFQVTNCGALSFRPKFTIATSGKTSRQKGASLDVKLSYPKNALGKEANIAKVKVSLPKQLPSRLTTLQKACPDSTFNSNPAACPAASIVGHAVVHTQILPVPLTGPAYFVSHGGEEFPNLIVVLQGDGVTVDLVADTFIKNGVTSSTFSSTPDVPFEDFELVLPQGQYSALAANGSLCSTSKMVSVKKRIYTGAKGHHSRIVVRKARKSVPVSLVMPTIFTTQNGLVIRRNTPIAVTGCSEHRASIKKKARKGVARK